MYGGMKCQAQDMWKFRSRLDFRPEPETGMISAFIFFAFVVLQLCLCFRRGRNLACPGQQPCSGAPLAFCTAKDRAWIGSPG